MAAVKYTSDALDQLTGLPLVIQRRVEDVVLRLAKWPQVSGAKPLRGNLKGNYRIRTGDYRVVFRILGEEVLIWKIGYRGDIYD